MSVTHARNLKKLVDGDEGYDPNVVKYEVENVTTQVKSSASVCSIAEIDAKIANLQAKKAEEIVRFDDQVAALEQLKLDLLALP